MFSRSAAVDRQQLLVQAHLVTLDGEVRHEPCEESRITLQGKIGRALIVLLPGLVTAGIWKRVERFLIEQGYDVAVMQIPGLGTSPAELKNLSNQQLLQGITSQLHAWSEQYRAQYNVHVTPIHLVAHSYSAPLSLLLPLDKLAEAKVVISGFHFVAPAFFFRHWKLRAVAALHHWCSPLVQLACKVLPFSVLLTEYTKYLWLNGQESEERSMPDCWFYPWYPLPFLYQVLQGAKKGRKALEHVSAPVWLYEGDMDILVRPVPDRCWRKIPKKQTRHHYDTGGHFLPRDGAAVIFTYQLHDDFALALDLPRR